MFVLKDLIVADLHLEKVDLFTEHLFTEKHSVCLCVCVCVGEWVCVCVCAHHHHHGLLVSLSTVYNGHQYCTR